MNYFGFHLVFILPPIFLLAWVQGQPVAGMGGFRARLGIPLLMLMALVYTTPWDNYLVWRGVWEYGKERVIGTIGYVPIEEYLFFLLQTLLTGLWLYWLLGRQDKPISSLEPYPWVRTIATGFWLVLSLIGATMLQWNWGVYLGLILIWAGPILALQWFIGAPYIWATKGIWLNATLIPTLYLWIADRIAIANEIWSISDVYTTRLYLLGLPIEEATFFLVTNLLVVQGVLLFLLFGNEKELI